MKKWKSAFHLEQEFPALMFIVWLRSQKKESIATKKFANRKNKRIQQERTRSQGMIKMTRCTLLDAWFDTKSKDLDKAEKEKKKDLITGEKK